MRYVYGSSGNHGQQLRQYLRSFGGNRQDGPGNQFKASGHDGFQRDDAGSDRGDP